VRRKYSKTCGFDYEMHRETVSNVFVDACGGFGKLGRCAGACMIDSVVLVSTLCILREVAGRRSCDARLY
jgi:hypothetical protein